MMNTRMKIVAASSLAGLAITLAAAPVASADLSDLVNVDVASDGHVTVSPGPRWPIPFWDGVKPADAKWSYKTGYNISPRYEFKVDPVTGERSLKRHGYDCGC